MIIPARRWFVVAAVLALLAPVALLWPGAAAVLLVVDVLWCAVFVLEALRVTRALQAGLSVQRESPPAFSLGRPLPVTYRWTHGGDRPLALRVREEVPALLSSETPERSIVVPGGGDVRESVTYAPRRRGKASAGRLHVRAISPLGMALKERRIEAPWSVTVFPNLVGASIRSLPTQAQRRREAGFRNVRRLGEGRVFESLKEWVPGEDTRTIDWKATARRGKVMSRQYEDERRQQVLIVLDAGRMLTAEIEGRPRLEAAIDAALQLAHSAVDHDDNVGLMVFADQVQQFVAPGRGKRALRSVLDALASVEGRLVEPDYPAAFAYLAVRNRKRALTVFFTDVIDRTASESLVAQIGTLRPRHLPLAVTLRDPALERLATARPANIDAAFQRAAAEELLAARDDALIDMRSRGVLVLDVLPAGAARAVVERYNELKRRAAI